MGHWYIYAKHCHYYHYYQFASQIQKFNLQCQLFRIFQVLLTVMMMTMMTSEL